MSTSVLGALPGGIPNPISLVGNAIGGAASKAAETAFEFFLGRIAQAIANAASKVLEQLFDYLDTSSTVSLTQGWFAGPRATEITRSVVLFAGVLLLLFLLVAIVQGLAKGDAGLMVRTAAVEVPMSILGMVVITAITGVLLALTDGISSLVLQGAPADVARFARFGDADAILNLGLFGFILIPLFILGAILVWIELVIRSSLIYLLLAFAPVVLAARVWPVLSGAWHQLCRIGIALIISKFAIALALGLGAAALAGGGPGNVGASGPNANTAGAQVGLSVGGVVVGASLMMLSAFAPFVILKLLPVFEAAVLAQGIKGGPVRAAQTTAQGAYYVQGLKRLAGSNAGGPGTYDSATPTGASGGGAGAGGPRPTGGSGPGTGGGAGSGPGPAGAGATSGSGGGAGGASGGAAGAGAATGGAAAAAMVPVGVAAGAAKRAAAAPERLSSR